jgi:hypothetical protein
MDHVESHFGPFGCKIGAWFARLRTIGFEIILDKPVLLGDEAQMEAHFGPFVDSANLEAS